MIHFLADSVITPLLPFFLGLIAIILYCDLNFFPFSKIRRVLSSLFSSTDSSSWRALSVALAGTLGVGNIVGVAYAITTAGAGALFWMWASALLAMILKYGETLLAIKYRKNISQNKHTPQYIGGAMYYIPNRTLAAMFAILCIASSFTVGNLLQTKAVSDAFALNLSLSPYLVGTMLAILTLFVIWRGIRRITQFCSVVIPFLSLIYLLMCIAVLLKNASSV
ncbi:MAG: alanine:cation symporter family protein, partial [Clostridia bacterium]|nr:alanine:cation symporter family protein [Clostridia bacterium]